MRKSSLGKFLAAIRASVSRRDIRELVRVVRKAGPDAVVRSWPKVRPVERVASFRALSPRAAAEVFAALPADGKWLAYLGVVSEGAAPLLEGARPSDAKLLRRATKRELNTMRKAISG
jgi:hypothetical protein